MIWISTLKPCLHRYKYEVLQASKELSPAYGYLNGESWLQRLISSSATRDRHQVLQTRSPDLVGAEVLSKLTSYFPFQVHIEVFLGFLVRLYIWRHHLIRKLAHAPSLERVNSTCPFSTCIVQVTALFPNLRGWLWLVVAFLLGMV